MKKYLSLCLSFSFVIFLPVSSVTAKGLEACFLAQEPCEAYQSFRKKTNPKYVRLEEGKFYPILERNKKKTAYRIRIKGLKRSARWVSESCGESLSICSFSDKKSLKNSGKLVKRKTKTDLKKPYLKKTYSEKSRTKKADKKKAYKKKKQPDYLLALTWQPSFCETHSRKKECRTQTRKRYDATHLSLHGLWPQPRSNAYCGVSNTDKGIDRNGRWHLLEPVKLTQKTAIELAFTMPGAASNLQRHEWIKHGTCYGTDAETYYSDAISLTKQVNQSVVGKLFTFGVGKKVSLKQVRQHFDKAFGKGAGKKVDMRCDKGGRVSELWINLKGEVTKETKIADLMKNAINAGSKCRIGIIDRAN